MTTQIRRINRNLMIGWLLMAVVLCISYLGEVGKGQRSIAYMAVFTAVTVLPLFVTFLIYRKNPERERLAVDIVIGFFFMYVFVMLTASTTLVFTYILPLLAFIVLYHSPRLVLWTGIAATALNLLSVFLWQSSGRVSGIYTKDVEIQLGVLFICIIGAFMAARIYDMIYRTNHAYAHDLAEQKEELFQQAEELESVNGELNRYTEELRVKNEEMQEMTMQTIMTIANTIDAKDEYTRGHSRRVSEYSAAIAAEMGLPKERISDIRFIGLLHDIGKIGVPDAVLNKPGKLSEEEYQLMKDHTVTGAEILRDITMIADLDVGAKYHHERYDGKGYPEGLSGEAIPLIARIIAVADAYDAMTSNRVYRRHLPPEKVLAELKKGNGVQFDPNACSAMLRLIEEDRLPQFLSDHDPEEVEQASRILSRVIDKAEEVAQEELQTDELTGALSRGQGVNAIQEEIHRVGEGSLFVFDIDHFRKINETEGFSVGDRFLRILADEIRTIPEELILSRFGADEFVAYMPEINNAEDAEEIAGKFLEKIRGLTERDASVRRLTVSIGITQIATEKDRVMVAYENASKALFVAKQYGEGSFFCYRLLEDDEDNVAAANSSDMDHLVEILRQQDTDLFGPASQDVTQIYHSIHEIARKYENRVIIILFTLRAVEEGTVSIEERDEIMDILERAIAEVIRNVGDALRYSNVQYAVLLAGMGEDETRQIINHILADFYKMHDRKNVEVLYDTRDLGMLKEE